MGPTSHAGRWRWGRAGLLALLVIFGCSSDAESGDRTGAGAGALPVGGAIGGASGQAVAGSSGTGVATAGVGGGVAPAGTGGAAPTAGAGAVGVGGSSGAGGATPAGGAGGAMSTGGTMPTGGAGGSTTTGPCSRAVGSCAAPEVRITDVDVASEIIGYGGEADTEPLPIVMAAMPSGGSRVAWLGTDGNVHVAELDCDDHMVGTPISFPAYDIQDIYADDAGGVLLLTRDATGSGTDHCGPGPLCGGTSAPCYDMYLVRFDASGTEEWATKVTNLSDSLEGYDNGARFVWRHYQHHGRIAFDGNDYAAYFCIGITVQNNSCIDIHEGDRMQVVSASGAPVDNPQAFQVGCSHSWTTRIVWDPRSSQFEMVCATDNPDPATGSPCRIARPAPYRTIAPVECDGRFWGGDLVLASGAGYWTAYTQRGAINLVHFTDAGPDQTIDNAGSADHAKLVSYGADHMLLAWESGQSMAAQVLDSATGAAVGSQLAIDVRDHNYHAFKAYPDGSVAYPAIGASNTTLRIARVMPCQ